jgi:LysR family glycine cleavage system transcriptional activator
VSQQIRRLEAAIGRPLFFRSHRAIRLSETGQRLAPKLQALFDEMNALIASIVPPGSLSLRISAMPSFAAKWLAPRLAEFSAREPAYEVRLAGEDALASFTRDDIDFGFRYGPGTYPGLNSHKIATAVAFPVCSPSFAARHPLELDSPDGLRHLPLLHDELAQKAAGLPTWSAWFEAADVGTVVPVRGLQFESHHLALEAAKAGQGVALGLTPLVLDDLRAGRLIRLFEVEVPSAFAFWLVHRTDRARERKIAVFREWVLEQAGAVETVQAENEDWVQVAADLPPEAVHLGGRWNSPESGTTECEWP